jgi:hypothetical protein
MDASQQKHRDKHKSRDCQRQVHYFRYDIGKNVAFGHGRLLNVHPKIMVHALYGATIAFTRMQVRFIFIDGKSTRPRQDGRYHCHPRASLSSPKRRSLWRFGRSADQCAKMKLPVFSHCSGKPNSADVPSVVYAGQRHPRTARFQLNNIAGFERLYHSPILQL